MGMAKELKQEHFVSNKVWNYRFTWIEKDVYLNGKREFIERHFSLELKNKETLIERLFLSAKYLFDFCVGTLEKDIGCPIRLEKVFGRNKRVPLETVFNDEIFDVNFGVPSTEWRYITINMDSLVDIAGKLLKSKSCTNVEREKYIEDWCEYLEGAMVQELAHVLFLEDTIKSSKSKELFVAQMRNYPKLDSDASLEKRRKKYLTTDIEKHGRLVQLDFLQKIYPKSWALAWCEEDVKEIKGLSA